MRRPVRRILAAPFDRRFWVTYYRIFSNFERPLQASYRYTTSRGRYPVTWRVRANDHHARLTLYSPDDFVTLVECFAKVDYEVPIDAMVIVDVGANIGISGSYFLTAAPQATLYAFEPSPPNIKRLETNLRLFEGRWTLSPTAWSNQSGEEDFYTEPTGRYGSLVRGRRSTGAVTVPVVDAKQSLSTIISREGAVDMLKLDIEGKEKEILRLLTPVLRSVHRICAEISKGDVSLPGFTASRKGMVVTYSRAEDVEADDRA